MPFFKNVGEHQFDSLVAENAFIHEIQLAIEEALDEHGMSQADLAAALQVSQPRVSQMLADNGKNLRARTIARVAHALGRKPFVHFIDHDAQWTLAEISDEGLFDGPSLATWMKTACETLEADEPHNENGWPVRAVAPADELMSVAA